MTYIFIGLLVNGNEAGVRMGKEVSLIIEIESDLFDPEKIDKLHYYFMPRSFHMQWRSRQKALQIQTDHFSINFPILYKYCRPKYV